MIHLVKMEVDAQLQISAPVPINIEEMFVSTVKKSSFIFYNVKFWFRMHKEMSFVYRKDFTIAVFFNSSRYFLLLIFSYIKTL